MVYLLGVPRERRSTVRRNLQRIKGIGPDRADAVCRAAGVAGDGLWWRTTKEQGRKLQATLEARYPRGLHVDLELQIKDRLQVYVTTNARRGIRRRLGLPVRGQRTKSNARTAHRLNAHRLARVGRRGGR